MGGGAMECSYVGPTTYPPGKNKNEKLKPGFEENESSSALGLSPIGPGPILRKTLNFSCLLHKLCEVLAH